MRRWQKIAIVAIFVQVIAWTFLFLWFKALLVDKTW